ncbi:allophanate hydrolase 2 subunit 2 [Vibrio ishigakensis]|uniref:Allophanate hydrolase 2 subunit 2 n=1 Tax=Vibrio ishigakensis TaxID=1481914 RepID=A0A0B8P1I6_9VIBR|nr:biotin-dependent carboxyltransferase family protein [Vibrio ishigakensis]GAM58402.1 allophanate hydrolase 2 subunit 2 [Vibrio ishigakensis]
MTPCLQILKAHTGTSLQDLGRANLAHYGITQGGAADEYAFNWANKLLANPYNSPAIEITLGGFEAKVLKANTIAITGAKNNVLINGKPVTSWQSYRVKANDILKLLPSREGLRSYLAVGGGFDVPLALGSCATVLKDKLGGLNKNGNPLAVGDLLSSHDNIGILKETSVSPTFIPEYTQEVVLRVIAGSQAPLFDESEYDKLFQQSFLISPAASKMGYQLKGEPIKIPKADLISEPIALGAIQIPPSGEPIIMLCERQTIGGYHKLGQVARMDISKLAQARPGQQIRFVPVRGNASAQEYVSWLKFFDSAYD